ncbi:MAG: deoxynucleoside kinase [Bacteroidota bacterium]
MYIAIEGNIGAGKTSLVHKLCDRVNAIPLLEEFAENSFLPKFYEDPEKFAFPLELSFLAARYKQMTSCFDNHHGKIIISDYLIHKCKLFASVNLTEVELELFDSLFSIMADKLPVPDKLIYLDSDTDRLSKNISIRGRSYEKAIAPKYLDQLSHAYKHFLKSETGINTLIINTSQIDFVHSETDFESLASLILGNN